MTGVLQWKRKEGKPWEGRMNRIGDWFWVWVGVAEREEPRTKPRPLA